MVGGDSVFSEKKEVLVAFQNVGGWGGGGRGGGGGGGGGAG